MNRIQSSILISKSVEDTFAFLNVAENHTKFIPNMAEFKQTSAGVFGKVGATVQGVMRVLGIKIKVPYEIIEHEINRRLAMKGLMGPIVFMDGYVLNSTNNGTQIDFWLELTMTGLSKVLSPFGGLIGRVHAYETLNNLKKALEKTG